MTHKQWQVWAGENVDNVIFSGSHTACLKYYKRNGGSKAGLHIGYEI